MGLTSWWQRVCARLSHRRWEGGEVEKADAQRRLRALEIRVNAMRRGD